MSVTTTATEKVWAACGKCSGKGHIRGFEGIAGGICFACAGAGGEWVESKVLARRAAARKRSAAARVAANEARLVQLNVDRRAEGWDWAGIRSELCGQDSDADSMMVDLWEGHEDHAKFPGWARADGSVIVPADVVVWGR